MIPDGRPPGRAARLECLNDAVDRRPYQPKTAKGKNLPDVRALRIEGF